MSDLTKRLRSFAAGQDFELLKVNIVALCEEAADALDAVTGVSHARCEHFNQFIDRCCLPVGHEGSHSP